MFGWLKRWKHARILETPFPAEWIALLERHLPLYEKLTAEEQKRLRDKVQIFIAQKNFEGAGGLEITDEMKVTIAGQACVLLLHLDEEEDVFPTVESIVVYPSAYKVPGVHKEGGIVSEEARAGEAWQLGTVVLSWDAVLHGAHDPRDGHNLVLHEFAHALDQEDGAGDGAPVLPKRSMYGPWAHVLGEEYEDLVWLTEHGRKSLIDAYGATNPAEFFAVITETFFEKPAQLKRKHPELYEQLVKFYRQDPASR